LEGSITVSQQHTDIVRAVICCDNIEISIVSQITKRY